MIIHLNCPPIAGGNTAILDWDPETGEVSGPSAEIIRKMATRKTCPAYPIPCVHRLSADPLRSWVGSWVDMAAMIGYTNELPPELAAHYPAKGRPVGDVDGLVY